MAPSYFSILDYACTVFIVVATLYVLLLDYTGAEMEQALIKV
jgi:hypothetical protein